MSGVVVVAGRFEPGTVVRLVRVQDESVLRGEYGELVGERVVDADGAVGWDGLDVGGSYFAQGYVDGGYLELRCRGVDASEPQGSLSQPPVPPAQGTLGTGNAANVEVPPAPPEVEEGQEPLPEGLPDGVSLSELGVKTYYLHNGESAPSADWRDVQLQTPAETAADGTVLDARPLYEWVGDGEPDLGVGTGEKPEWEAYEGPTEAAGTTPAQSTLTDTSGQETVPVAPDAPPSAEAAPADQAGAPEAQQPSEVQVQPPTAPAAGEAVPVSVEGEVNVTPAPPAETGLTSPTPEAPPAEVTPPAPPAEAPPAAPAPVSPAPTEGAAQPDSPAEPAPVEATDGGAPATSSEAAPAPVEAAAPAAPVEEAAAEPQPAQPVDGGAGDAGSAPAPPVPAPEAPPESPAPEAPAEGAPEAAPDAEKGQ